MSCFLVLMYKISLNFEAFLISYTSAEVDAMKTSQLNCNNLQSHLDELDLILSQWQNLLENKVPIPSHIETLAEMKHLIKYKK